MAVSSLSVSINELTSFHLDSYLSLYIANTQYFRISDLCQKLSPPEHLLNKQTVIQFY